MGQGGARKRNPPQTEANYALKKATGVGQWLRMNPCKVPESPWNSCKAVPTSLSLTLSTHSSSVGKNLSPSPPFSLLLYCLLCMLFYHQSPTLASCSLFSGPAGKDKDLRLWETCSQEALLPQSPRLIPICSSMVSLEAVGTALGLCCYVIPGHRPDVEYGTPFFHCVI